MTCGRPSVPGTRDPVHDRALEPALYIRPLEALCWIPVLGRDVGLLDNRLRHVGLLSLSDLDARHVAITLPVVVLLLSDTSVPETKRFGGGSEWFGRTRGYGSSSV